MSDIYEDLRMPEFVDWDDYENTIWEEIMSGPDARKDFYDAERVVSAWDNDHDYWDLDPEDDYTEDDWDDLEDDVDPSAWR